MMKIYLNFLLFWYFVALPLSIAGMEFFSWSIVLSLAVYSCVKRRKDLWVKLGPDKLILVFNLTLLVGAFFVSDLKFEDRKYIVGETRWIFVLYGITALFHYFRNSHKVIRYAFWGLLGLLVLIAIYSCIQFFTGINYFKREYYSPYEADWGVIWRAKGFFSNTMSYSYVFGMLFSFYLPFLTFSGFKKKKLFTGVLLVSLLIIATSLILTITRGMWVAVFVAVSFILFQSLNLKKIIIIYSVAGLMLIVGVLQVDMLRSRFSSFADFKNNKSNNHRINLWRAHIEMAKDHLWLGVGYRQNSKLVPEYYERLGIKSDFVGHAHNVYLQILTGLGLPGLLAYLGFMFSFFLSTYRAFLRVKNTQMEYLKSSLLGGLAAQIVFHIGGLSEPLFTDGEILHNTIAILGLSVILVKKTTELKPEELVSE